MTLDKDTYKAGEQAVIDIRPPSDGQALIVIASDRIHKTRLMDVPASGAKVFIPVDSDWGPGVYALVTHMRALNEGPARAPVRSIGLGYLSIDQSERTLGVALDLPEVTEPKTDITVPVTVTGAEGEAFVTLAAVDEGILQLTDFVSPAPSRHYFGKRRLGVDIRDDYGR